MRNKFYATFWVFCVVQCLEIANGGLLIDKLHNSADRVREGLHNVANFIIPHEHHHHSPDRHPPEPHQDHGFVEQNRREEHSDYEGSVHNHGTLNYGEGERRPPSGNDGNNIPPRKTQTHGQGYQENNGSGSGQGFKDSYENNGHKLDEEQMVFSTNGIIIT